MVKNFIVLAVCAATFTACGSSENSKPAGDAEAKVVSELAGYYQACTPSSANQADASEALMIVIKSDAGSTAGGSLIIERAKWNNRNCQGAAESSVNSAKDLITLTKKGAEYRAEMGEGTLQGQKKSNLIYTFKKSGKNIILTNIIDKSSGSRVPAQRDVTFVNVTAIASGVVVAPDKLAVSLKPILGNKYIACSAGSFNAGARSEGTILHIESETKVSLKKGVWNGVRDCSGVPSEQSDSASNYKELRLKMGQFQFLFESGKYEGVDQKPILYQFQKAGNDMKLLDVITINSSTKWAFDQPSEIHHEVPLAQALVFKLQPKTR